MKLPKVGFHCKLMLVMYLNGFEKWQEKEFFSFWHSTLFIIYHSVRDNVTTLVISSEWSSTTVCLPLIKRHVGNPQSSYGSSNSEYCSCSSKFRFEPCSFKIFSTVSCELNNIDAFCLQVKLCATKENVIVDICIFLIIWLLFVEPIYFPKSLSWSNFLVKTFMSFWHFILDQILMSKLSPTKWSYPSFILFSMADVSMLP